MTKSRRPVHVGHLYGSIQRCGGVERVLEDLVTGIPAQEVKQELFLLRRLPQREERTMPAHVAIWPTRPWPMGTPANLPGFRLLVVIVQRLRLATKILLSGVDILHIHRGTDRSHLLTALVARLFGIRVVRTVHRDPARDPEINLRLRFLIRWVDVWVVLTPEHAQSLEMRGASKQRIQVIPNGIDSRRACVTVDVAEKSALRAALGVPADAFLCLAVARLDLRQKDFPTLLRAFATVRRQVPSAWLVVAGEGSGRQEIQRLIERMNLAGRVRLLGHRDDISALMAVSDLLAFATRWEGFGLVAAEAMFAGLPVVATDVGGLRFVLDGGNAGILVPPEDDRAMAQAIRELAVDPELRARLSAIGRERAARYFDKTAMLDRYRYLWVTLSACAGR